MTRRRRNPSVADMTGLLKWGLIAVGAYLVYSFIKKSTGLVTGAAAAVGQAQQAAGSAVADLFPTNIAQPGGSFTVTQADGTQVTVPYGWKAGDPIPRDESSDIDLSTMNF